VRARPVAVLYAKLGVVRGRGHAEVEDREEELVGQAVDDWRGHRVRVLDGRAREQTLRSH
jgi:hypothetical protein